jgi:hypothetical protein
MKNLYLVLVVLGLSVGRLVAGPPCADISGDVNADGGTDLSDAVYSLAFSFQGGAPPEPFCVPAGPNMPDCTILSGDGNGDGGIDLSDAIYILSFLFQGGPAPLAACPPDSEPEGFLDHGDGTITDHRTGLMWQKVTADVGDDQDGNNDGSLDWCEALTFADDLDFAGHTDWRLPNIRELNSIVDPSQLDPAIDPVFEARPLAYWSSTTRAFQLVGDDCQGGNPTVGEAWTNSFNRGWTHPGGVVKRLDICGAPNCGSCEVFIRAVRGVSASLPDTGRELCYAEDGTEIVGCGDTTCPAQDADNAALGVGCPNDANRFVDNGDATITDTCTDLMWMQDSLDTDGQGVGEDPTNFNGLWDGPGGAIEFAEGLDFAGHDDWRIPSLHELESLVDYKKIIGQPSIHPLFNSTQVAYWSSTPALGFPDPNAWAVEFNFGATGPIFTPAPGCPGCFINARAVRSVP